MSHEQKLEQALHDFVTEVRAYQSPECEECEIIGPLLRQADAVLSAPKAEAHPDDKAVDRFAEAMKIKLAQKRKEGRGGWWDDAYCNNSEISAMLREHVEKGDPLDVGNLAMMLHQRGERIAPAPKAEAVTVKPLEWKYYRDGDADAVTPFGDVYTAYASGYWRLTERGKAGKIIRAGFDGASARAAVQADYEARIRSVIYTSPVPAITDEAVERAVQKAAHIGYVTCAETRHVTLGDKVRDAILAAFPSKGGAHG